MQFRNYNAESPMLPGTIHIFSMPPATVEPTSGTTPPSLRF